MANNEHRYPGGNARDRDDSNPNTERFGESVIDKVGKRAATLGNPTDRSTPSLAEESALDETEVPTIPLVLRGFEEIREIARGGSGIVYRAKQTSLGRVVAIKALTRLDRRDVEVQTRFKIEAETLAQLRHPNLVQVFESGVADGIPYLVLEWFEAGSLADRIRAGVIPIRETALIVECIARAVAYIHNHGVIHRDLKPGNILLTDEGIPKVSDFGMAKNLGVDLNLTQAGYVVGTPHYMAPEQTRGDWGLTTSVDVYALGVMLYEMLTGKVPFQARSLEEVFYKVRDEEPVEVSLYRPDTPPDLEAICLKCLEKSPARRYPSANHLADDLQRFLDNRTVVARKPTLLERYLRFCRRNVMTASLTAVVALLLMVLAIGGPLVAWRESSLRQLAQEAENAHRFAAAAARTAERRALSAEALATSENQLAQNEKARANQQAQITKAVNEFFIQDLLLLASPRHQANKGMVSNPNLTLREALDRASASVGTKFANQPVVEAAIRQAIGTAYLGLGDNRRAIPHFQSAVKLRTKHVGPNQIETLQAIKMLGSAVPAKEAIPLLENALERCRLHLRPHHPEFLGITQALAGCYRALKIYDRALALFEESYEGRKLEWGLHHVDTMRAMNNYGMALLDVQRNEEANLLFMEAYRLRVEVLGPEHPDTLVSLSFLANLHVSAGNLSDGLALMENAVKGFEERLGICHPETVRQTYQLAVYYLAMDRSEQANFILDRCMNQMNRKTNMGVDGTDYIIVYRPRMASNAIALLRSALSAQRERNPPHLPLLADTLGSLGARLTSEKKLVEAEQVLRECLALRQQFSPSDWATFETQARLGAVLLARNLHQEAEFLLRAGHDGMKAHPAPIDAEYASPRLRQVAKNLIALYESTDQHTLADAYRDPHERP